MKRALITGHRGFCGRHFWRFLLDRGWDGAGVDLAAPFPSDARQFFLTSKTRFDLVVHCAAVVGGRAVIDGSPLAQAPNLALDSMLFEWAQRTRPGRIIYLSSSAVYPVRYQFGVPHRLREDDVELWGRGNEPDQLYGFAKLAGEILAERAREDGLPVTVVRPFSGSGTDQSWDYPFPAMIDRARRREEPFVVWGDGNQVRDFIHIDDVVAAAFELCSASVDGPVNLGTGRPTSMFSLAEMISERAGYSPLITPLTDKPSGVAYRVADVTRMNEFYPARISLEEGINMALQER